MCRNLRDFAYFCWRLRKFIFAKLAISEACTISMLTQVVDVNRGTAESGPDEVEIARQAEKWNITLQKNIAEEINNFNMELKSLKESCASLNCDELIGSRSELIQMKSDVSGERIVLPLHSFSNSVVGVSLFGSVHKSIPI